jgi:hypothetical protein
MVEHHLITEQGIRAKVDGLDQSDGLDNRYLPAGKPTWYAPKSGAVRPGSSWLTTG